MDNCFLGVLDITRTFSARKTIPTGDVFPKTLQHQNQRYKFAATVSPHFLNLNVTIFHDPDLNIYYYFDHFCQFFFYNSPPKEELETSEFIVITCYKELLLGFHC